MNRLPLLVLFAASSVTAAPAPAKLEVVGAVADADQKRADNVYDGETADKFENGWGAQGDGHWVTLDLGKPCSVSAVRIAFHRPKGRIHTFEIQASLDDSKYHTVFDGGSSAKDNEFDRFDFPPAAARYVRFVGHTIRLGYWSGVMEMEVWGVADGGSSASPDELAYTPPRPLPQNPAVEMPKSARGRTAGRFSFRALVRPDGSVDEVTALRAPTDVGLQDAIAKTVSKKWRFEPARRGKVAVGGVYAATVEMFSDHPQEAELKKLAAQFFEAYDGASIEPVLTLLDPEPRTLFSENEVPPSRDEARAWLEERFAQADRPRFSDLRYERVDLDPFGDLGPLNQQLAIVTCSARIDGKDDAVPRAHFELLFVKRKETGWRAARLPVPAAPLPAPPPTPAPPPLAETAETTIAPEPSSEDPWGDDTPTAVGQRKTFYMSIEGLPVQRSAIVEVMLDAEGKAKVIEVIARSKTADDEMIKASLLSVLRSVRRNYDGKAKILTVAAKDYGPQFRFQ